MIRSECGSESGIFSSFDKSLEILHALFTPDNTCSVYRSWFSFPFSYPINTCHLRKPQHLSVHVLSTGWIMLQSSANSGDPPAVDSSSLPTARGYHCSLSVLFGVDLTGQCQAQKTVNGGSKHGRHKPAHRKGDGKFVQEFSFISLTLLSQLTFFPWLHVITVCILVCLFHMLLTGGVFILAGEE